MRLIRNIGYLAVMLVGAMMCGCDDTLDRASDTLTVSVAVEMPADVNAADVTDAVTTFRNLSTGTLTKFTATTGIQVPLGLYDIQYEAAYHTAAGVETRLRASRQSVQITSNNQLIELKAFNNIMADDFIISEIFFTGTLQTSGNSYVGDNYVKICNNTDHVLYADGLALIESKFLTTENHGYTPDIISTDLTVDAVYVIPGSGMDHPVEPGGTILLADNAIDHRVINPNSMDLSHADWEWYDVSTKPSVQDIDNPMVPNLERWYCYTQSIFTLHSRGFKAYGLARIPVDRDTYVSDYRYDYDYELVVAAGTFPMSASAYRMPNEWIVDVVNLSVQAKYQWNVTAPQLDCGWTYCGTVDNDKTRFGKSVKRRVLYTTTDGRTVLKDTNNSSVDFEPECVPTETAD